MTNESTPADSLDTSITAQPVVPAAPPATDPTAPAPPVVATPPTWPFKADMVLLALLLTLSFLLAAFTASNSDLWLNLAIGKRIGEGKFEFGVDPYSWATETADGKPAVYWVHHSWLFSWLVYQVYLLGGGMALVIGKAVLFTATIGLLCRVGWNNTNRWFILICLLMAALAVSGRLFVQPMVVSYLFLAITLFVLARAGVFTLTHPSDHEKPAETPGGDVRCLWWLPLLFVFWANLDVWFILGPIVVGLCWAASGLALRFGGASPVPGKTLGLVFGASVAACLINPHHVRVFQLPPELAYVVLSAADPLSLPVPDELVAAGRTLREFQKAEPKQPWTASTLSPSYWMEMRIGMNVAGWAVFPLLLLGLFGFVLTALVRAPGKAPTLQASRFVLWLVFAVLALALHRVIPFFALVAAPLTALTLGEFLDWQQTINAVTVEKRDRGLALARWVSLPVLLLLLFGAWPGWLHGTNEYNSPRRVAFDMRLENSLLHAAQSLQALQDNAERGNVFNGNPELGNCLPWFAPGMKHAVDARFALFASQMPRLIKVRNTLTEHNSGNADEWQALFQERGVRQVALASLLQEGRIFKWWLDAENWQQRYADRKNFVFTWAGPGKTWPANTARDEWNRQAFGAVASNRRPPPAGTAAPQAQDFWTMYLEGTGQEPAAAFEAQIHKEYFVMASRYQSAYGLMNLKPPKHPWPLPTASFRIFSASLVSLQAVPDGATTVPQSLAAMLHQWTLYRQRDVGPPALPVLMMRAARLAVAENPYDPVGHLALLDACETLHYQQEDYWINFPRRPGLRHPSEMRERLRQAQVLASAYHIVQLLPDDPDHHFRLAMLYQKQNFVDLALDHMEETYKSLDKMWNTGPRALKDSKERDGRLKSFRDTYIIPLAQTVKLRLATFKEISEQDPPLGKVAKALGGPFRDLVDGRMEETALGLAKKSMELLNAIDPKTLKKEETIPFEMFRLEMRLNLGQAGDVAHYLKDDDVRKGPMAAVFAHLQLFAAGAVGDYEAMEESLAALQERKRDNLKKVRDEVNFRRAASLAAFFVMPTMQNQPTVGVALTLPTPLIAVLNDTLTTERIMTADLFNTMTLRGIMALEAGETKQAREFFQSALKEAGNEHFFPDRPIATRYLELLEEQKR